jgi:hypothetical protein
LEINPFTNYDFSHIITRMQSSALLANIAGTSIQHLLQTCIKSVKIWVIPVNTGLTVNRMKKEFRRGLRHPRKELKSYRVLRQIEIQGPNILPKMFLEHKFGFSKRLKKGRRVLWTPLCVEERNGRIIYLSAFGMMKRTQSKSTRHCASYT